MERSRIQQYSDFAWQNISKVMPNLFKTLLILSIPLTPLISTAGDIDIYGVSIHYGYEGVRTFDWPPEDSDAIFTNKYFLKDNELALDAEVDISQYLNNQVISTYNNKKNKFFLLFFNMIDSEGCDKDYLIQRVRIKKVSYDFYGKQSSTSWQHLVEVFKIQNGNIKKADRHIKKYSLNKEYIREVFTDVEVGCGKIPGIVEGKHWLYGRNSLYKLIQDYSAEPGLYDDVYFDFSSGYTFDFSFAADGSSSIELPYFIQE